MFKDELGKFVKDNPKLVTMRESKTYPGLYVLKYSRTVFFNDLWNEYLEECRGTIVDADFNVISRPFTKIYNFRVEPKSPVIDDSTMVTAYRKVNGFMVAMTWHNKDVLVSTTGSTDSDYVHMAKEMMLKHMSWADWQMSFANNELEGITVMFEACHKNDPHIIPEKEGLHILGYCENSWGSKVGHNPDVLDALAEMFNCHKAQGFTTTVGELVKLTKTVQHEGFVAYTNDGQAFKIKSPYYLIQKALARKKDIMTLNKELVDEEYYPLVAHLNGMYEQFNNMEEQDRLAYMRHFLEK